MTVGKDAYLDGKTPKRKKKTAERVATKVEIVAILGAGGDTDGSEQ